MKSYCKKRMYGALGIVLSLFFSGGTLVNVYGQGKIAFPSGQNLAFVAKPTSSSRGATMLTWLNDSLLPNNNGSGNRQLQRLSVQWVQYEWTQLVSIRKIAVFWWNYKNSIKLPSAYRLLYWDGNNFIPVKNATGLGLENNQFNSTTFDEIKTTRLRLEVDSTDRPISTLLEWVVFKVENSPDYPPFITEGIDRSLILGGITYLSGKVKSLTPINKIEWSKVSGPGEVNFTDAQALNTTATFSALGDYILSLTVTEGNLSSSTSLKVNVQQPPQVKRLDVVYTKQYKIDSPLWNDRIKAMIINWIPYCIENINRTTRTPGGLDNFIEAGKALRGEKHGKHVGAVWSAAWVHQTVESMCIALMIDPQGDKEIIAAQEKMKKTLEEWIPIILAAQEPDGYLHTAYTLRDTSRWKERWSPVFRANHEGYVAGYFLESAINHYTLTEGKDKRLYDAAKKLADCWVANIGPGKKEWYDGHQEMEQALVRFGRFVNDMEGSKHGDSYIALSKFLLDCRKNGSEYDQSHVSVPQEYEAEYDQSHLPVKQQYEAVGHAVRAVYCYSGMADIAAETGDIDYQSAVLSLWDNIVNKKYYITGGIGSGESPEGFGPNYSLRNNAMCESCSSCGLIFFQYKMNLAYHDAKYADLFEETIYNALLGSLDLDGKNFYYSNPLSSSQSRYQFLSCCAGNISRTLLMIPTWTYLRSDKGLYVNMFIGSTIKVEKVAGTDIEMIQKTDYPWSGKVSITVNPKQSKEFTIFVRLPNRTTSALYTPTPTVSGLKSLAVNGKTMTPKIVNGYAAIKRTWKTGDKVDFELPMEIQTITADEKIQADRGRIAIRYGPLIYNVEKVDQPNIEKCVSTRSLTLDWRDDLLNGVMTINGKWDDGTPMLAIPNYARNNRNKPGPENKEGGSIVWIKKQPLQVKID